MVLAAQSDYHWGSKSADNPAGISSVAHALSYTYALSFVAASGVLLLSSITICPAQNMDPSPPRVTGRRKTSPSCLPMSSVQNMLSVQKIEIFINVYDLLPRGKLSTLLWTIGSSLLHSGVVIKDREYAYGGHDRPGTSGVYWTKPNTLPPGGTFRAEILHGITSRSESDVASIISGVSEEFLGQKYNLLSRNCNHFTSALCERLMLQPTSAPGWLNRAATIGLALPCMVPRQWIEPPDYETAEGELLGDEQRDDHEDRAHDGDSDDDERSRMLRHQTTPQRDSADKSRESRLPSTRDTTSKTKTLSQSAK